MTVTIVDMHVRLNENTSQHLKDLVNDKKQKKNTALRSSVSKNSVINECINLRHQDVFSGRKDGEL